MMTFLFLPGQDPERTGRFKSPMSYQARHLSLEPIPLFLRCDKIMHVRSILAQVHLLVSGLRLSSAAQINSPKTATRRQANDARYSVLACKLRDRRKTPRIRG